MHSSLFTLRSSLFHGISRGSIITILLVATLLALFATNLLVGSIHIPIADVWNILWGHSSDHATWNFVVRELRLPAALTALLSGASLAVSGLMLQTVFRNPLAGPGLFGINSGASLGVAVVMLVMGGSVGIGSVNLTGFLAIFFAAFLGAMLVLLIILAAASVVRNHVMLLIVGIMVGYLASSAISLFNFFATEEGVQSYMVWGLGNFGGVSSEQLPLLLSVNGIGLAISLLFVKPLNALLLGDQYAENLGFKVIRLRNALLLVTGILTAITTAFCGPVAFIGLIVPHITRLLLGTDNHRPVLPLTMLTGSCIALLCNFICSLPADKAIPLNAITPLIGAPIIVYVIARHRE